MIKALGIKQLSMANPGIYDAKAVDKRILRMMRVDNVDDLFLKEQPSAPDPKMIEATAKMITARNQEKKIATDGQLGAAKLADAKADRESKENIETTKLAQAVVVHHGNQSGSAFDQAHRTKEHDLATLDSHHTRTMDIYDRLNPPEPATTTKPKKKD